MKSFRLYKSGFKFKKIEFKKILNFFRFLKFFKKPIVLTILISVLVSLIVGTLAGIYIAPQFRSEPQGDLDLFLETQSEDQEETASPVSVIKSIPQVVSEASPAVVSIIVSKYVPIIEQYYYNPFGEDSPFEVRVPGYRIKGQKLQEVGGGSGFIVSSDGLIITNKHVVLDEDAEYTVLTNDGQKYPALVLARDPFQDIAVLKMDAHNLSIIRLGNSDILQIGQTVIAIGNALGEFRNTVSVGVVSGLMRTITAGSADFSEQLEEVIQTDAAINKGNSGGPLLNLYGQVIGINTAMAEQAENIGFAIPINKVKKDINDIETYGKIVYPYLGIRYVPITKEIAEENNLSVDYGILIVRGEEPDEVAIALGSAAERAGLKEGDIILEFNGVVIDEKNTLAKLILKYKPGDAIALKVLRDNQEITLSAILGEWE
jgi:serine protease Do